jgi:hypothetical protein
MALRLGYAMLAAVLMDLISLIVVAYYCVVNKSRDISLGRYFLRQGLLSFIFICLVNIAAAIEYFKPPRFFGGVGIPVAFMVSNILACRIILQLRAKVNPTSTQLDQLNSLMIDNVLSDKKEDSWLMDEEV